MRESLHEPIRVHKAKYKTKKIFRKIASVLGCVVAFVTTYALILPAITMEQTTYCGVQEHIHEEFCYRQQVEHRTMICNVGSDLHVHTAECYGADGNVICGQADYIAHSHNSFCWNSEDELICTLPEHAQHVHGNSCYGTPTTTLHNHSDQCIVNVKGDLICTQQESQAHAHTDDCYQVTDELQCGKAEGHTHGADCYDAQEQLVCNLEENHFHDASCYVKKLICQIPEYEGHEHDDSCYHWEQEYVCGLEEGALETSTLPLICTEPVVEEHNHDSSCFEISYEEAEPVCGQEHEHTYSCYPLLCTQMTHTHSLQCYSNPEADVESQKTWEATMDRVKLTGDPYVDVIAIAESQLGYAESTENYMVGEDNSTYGYTRYGDWYGSAYGDWCAMFASFCLRYAGVDAMPIHSHVGSWIETLEEQGLYYSPEAKQPTPGCLVFFDWETNENPDHVGIVVAVKEKTGEVTKIKTIEGNSADAVRYVEYDIDDPVIIGYGFLPEENRDELLDFLICGTPAHTHDDLCEDCQLTEHIHMIDCVGPENPVGYAGYASMTMMRYALRSSGEIQYYSDIAPMLDSVTIKDANGNVIDGSITLGDMYEVTLRFEENTGNQFASGELTYQIPDVLVSEDVNESTGVDIIRNRDNEIVATYTIVNNLLTVKPYGTSNFFANHNDSYFELQFDAEAVFDFDETELKIDFGNHHEVTVAGRENGKLNTQKELVSYDPLTRTLTFKCTTTAHGGRVQLNEMSDWWWVKGGNVGPDDAKYSGITLKDGNGNDISSQWNITVAKGDEGRDMISLGPKAPCYLNHGESIVLEYQVKLSDQLNENFLYINEYYNYGEFGETKLKETVKTETPVTITNLEKNGVYVAEGTGGAKQDAIKWTATIMNPNQETITVTDQLVGDQTYCTEHNSITIAATRADNNKTDYFTVPWDNVTLNDAHTSFAYTLPEGYVKYELVYYSHYVFDKEHQTVQTFENNIKTEVNNVEKENVTGSVNVFGVIPTINKQVIMENKAYVTFRIECFMPAELNNQSPVFIYDELTSWSTIDNQTYYISNNPEYVTVTVQPDGRDAYQLVPYTDQENADGTYLLNDNGVQFELFFNTSQATSATSVWKCDVNSTLTIDYKIALDSPMLDKWFGQPTGETLRQFMERTGLSIANKAQLNYLTADAIESHVNYILPEDTLSKTGKELEDGVFEYSVWFSPCEPGQELFKRFEDGTLDVTSLTLTDTFDSQMEYVPGSLQIVRWQFRDDGTKQRWETFVPRNDSVPIFDESGTTMTISASNMILEGNAGWSLLDAFKWQAEKQRLEITYKLRVKEDVKNTTTEGILRFTNSVTVDWTESVPDDDPESVGPIKNVVSYDTGILDKSMHENAESNLLNFAVEINPNGLDLAPDSPTYILHDTMSANLMLMYETVKIEVLDANKNVIDTLSVDECGFSFEPDRNRMNFTMPDEQIIRLSYDCMVVATGGRSVNVSNKVELEGYSSIQDVVDSVFEVRDHTGNAGATSEYFYLQKQDAYTYQTLPNVTFKLYGDVAPENVTETIKVGEETLYYYKDFTTDEHGRVVVKHSQLAKGHMYALVEVAPPAGYLEQKEPYVFYMEDGAPPGIDTIVAGGFVVIENYPYGYELPKTGGAGNYLYVGAGLLLILTSAAYLMYKHRKRRREVT